MSDFGCDAPAGGNGSTDGTGFAWVPGGCARAYEPTWNCMPGFWGNVIGCDVNPSICMLGYTPPDATSTPSPTPIRVPAYPMCGPNAGAPSARPALADPRVSALINALVNQLKNTPTMVNDPGLDAVAQAKPSTSVIYWNPNLVTNYTTMEVAQSLFHEADHLFWNAPRLNGTAAPLGVEPTSPVSETLYASGGYVLVVRYGNGYIDAYNHAQTHNDIVAVFGASAGDQTSALQQVYQDNETTVYYNAAVVTDKASQMDDFLTKNKSTILTGGNLSDGSAVKAFMNAYGSTCGSRGYTAAYTIAQYYSASEASWTGTY